jgi:ribonuclease Z
MRPLFHPSLVNGRYGDPAVYVDTLFEKRSLMFDLGDIAALSPRKAHRIDQIFVSHTHIDHFVGFDQLLRLLVGREKMVQLHGPAGLAERVYHKLQGYCWDLVETYACDLVFIVNEFNPPRAATRTQFRLKTGFAPEPAPANMARDGALHSEPTFRVSAAMLEHHTSCLGFALQEAAHVNIWKNRLLERGLPVGAWLKSLKSAVAEGRSDDHPIHVAGPAGASPRVEPLGSLRDVLTVTPGQKIGYVTDVADTPANRAAIIALVAHADILFIEAAFVQGDAALARERAHLTTTAAGEIARAAGVRRIEPFHFSPRYVGEEERLLREMMAAFEESHG